VHKMKFHIIEISRQQGVQCGNTRIQQDNDDDVWIIYSATSTHRCFTDAYQLLLQAWSEFVSQ